MGWTEEEAYEKLNQLGQQNEQSANKSSKQPEVEVSSPESIVASDLPLAEKLEKLQAEIDKYEQQWQEHKQTLDTEDVSKAREEYQEYIDYVESMKQEAEYVDFERQFEQALKKAAQESKGQWIESQKHDLVNIKEQISVLEAHIEGYGSAGLDVNEAKRQLESYKQREKEVKATLEKEKVAFEYEATPRAPIGPSVVIAEKMQEIERDYQEAMTAIEKERVLQKKREIMEKMQAEYQKQAKAYEQESKTHDKLLTAAETIVSGADMAIEILSLFTGKPGELVKTGYKAVKNIASGAAEAYVDPDNAMSHIGTGIVKGAGDIIKDNISPGAQAKVIQKFKRLGIPLTPDGAKKVIQQGVTIAVDTSTGAIKGLSTPDGMILGGLKGAGKGFIDSALDVPGNLGLDKLPDSGIGKVVKGVGSYALDQTKNFAKGESVIYSDWQMK